MPKIKTHQAASKRFRRTKGGKGKLMRTRSGKSHLRRKKAKRVKRHFDRMKLVKTSGVRQRIRRLLPYIGKKK